MRKLKVVLLIFVSSILCMCTGCRDTKVKSYMLKVNKETAVTELIRYVEEPGVKTQVVRYADFNAFSNSADLFTQYSRSVSCDKSLLGALTENIVAQKTEYTEMTDKWGNITVTAIGNDCMLYKTVVDEVPIVIIRNGDLFYVGAENNTYIQVDGDYASGVLYTAWGKSMLFEAMALPDNINQRIVEIGDAAYTFEYYKLDEHSDTLYAGYLFDALGNLSWRYTDDRWYTVKVCTADVDTDIFKIE